MRRNSHIDEITLLLGLMLSMLGACGGQVDLHDKRQDLAKRWGVSIDDYVYPSTFPYGFFLEQLQSGDTLDNVHAIVVDYEKVLNCTEGGFREIYYYFGLDEASAQRIRVAYDDRLLFLAINTEDRDSPSIRTEGCKPGRLQESP